MKAAMKKILQAIGSYATTATALAGVFGVILTVTLFVAATKERNNKLDRLLDHDLPAYQDDISNKVDDISAKVDSLCLKVDSLNAKVDGQQTLIFSVNTKVEALSNSYARYLLNDKNLTTDQFYEYMEGVMMKSIGKSAATSWLTQPI